MQVDNNDRPEQVFYQAYLIRMWRESSQSGWRASAQSIHDGEIVRFGTLHALFAFLNSQAMEVASLSSRARDDDIEDDVADSEIES